MTTDSPDAFLRRLGDAPRASGDRLPNELRERYGLGVIDTAAAFLRLSAKRPAPGSILRRLLDSDSAESLPYAEPIEFEPDPQAPKLGPIGTIKVRGTTIPRFGLGCMRLLSQGGIVSRKPVSAIGLPRSPEASRHALLSATRTSGVRMLDLARGYGPWAGAAEGLMRDWFGTAKRGKVHYPPGLVIATKVGYRRELNGTWKVDLDPAFLRNELKASHAQFGARIPLVYLVVRSTPTTPVVNRPKRLATALRPLLDAQRKGLIDAIGIANVTAPEIDELCDAGPIDIVQNRFSLHSIKDPGARAVLDRTAALKLPLVTWGLFGEGVKPPPPPPPAVLEAALTRGVTVEEFTIALILQLGSHVTPLPGPGRRATVDSSIQATGLNLSKALVSTLLGELS